MQGFNAEHLQEKWAPILDHEGGISDSHRRMVTAVLLENQEKMLREEKEFLGEAPTNSVSSGGVSNFDPVLISLIRRAMPNLVAYDLAGVQPMNGPTGLIFAMRARYDGMAGSEALFDEADTAFSNSGINTGGAYTANSGVGGTTGFGTTGQLGGNPALLGNEGESGNAYSVGRGMDTAQAEDLGAGQTFNQMGFLDREGRCYCKVQSTQGRVLPGTGTRPQGNPWSEC